MSHTDEKRFRYDSVLEAADICNLKRERIRLLQGLAKREKMVVYGRRNSGKTSVVMSIVIPKFQATHKKSFCMFCDFMEVKNKESIDLRMHTEFQNAFSKTFPAKTLLSSISKYLKGLRPNISIDNLTGQPSLSLVTVPGEILDFTKILALVRENIAPHIPTLMVFDEFQDVALVPEAQGLFRKELQTLSASIIIMGSKRHLLSNMFSKPNAPFADFGSDIEFGFISYKEYHSYIEERFAARRLKISLDSAVLWQDLLNRNPEAVNIVGDRIVSRYENITIGEKHIKDSIASVLEERRGRFEQLLGLLGVSEEKVLIAVAKHGPVKQPSGKSFLRFVNLTHATVMKVVGYLLDHGFLEYAEQGYRLTNPLLAYYLRSFR
ncbi:MAG: hypothetical protein HY537_11360 [Deltaproteobacteria bacterium]|nr:hypothetical protein [Deltaproteobacteria bacterium]